MIKKIINWSFGAFFRTIGRILAYLGIGILILLFCSKSGLFNGLFLKVNASTNPQYWITNTDVPTYFDLFDCTETACNRQSSDYYTTELLEISEGVTREFAVTTKKYSLKGNGIVLRTSSNARYNKDYLYQTTFYVCSDVNIENNLTMSIYPSYYSDAFTNNNVFQSTNSYTLSGYPGLTPYWTYCFALSSIFSPGENGTYINLRMKSTSSVSGYYSLVGFTSESLGIYSGSVEDIVQNSGFATASSVEEVQTAVDEVKEETSKTNDLISDTSEPDTESSITSWQDKMIDNPLAEVLLLPLTVLQSIQSALQGTCSPLELTLPFIDYDVSIPCISVIFSQIEGLIPLWNSIGTIVSAIILYQYLVYLYNWIDDTISLKTKRMNGWGSV